MPKKEPLRSGLCFGHNINYIIIYLKLSVMSIKLTKNHLKLDGNLLII